MAYGYNNNYRRAGGYRPSSRYRVKRRRNYRRIRNRIIIIFVGLLICCLIVGVIIGMVRLVSSFITDDASVQVPTATATSTTATEAAATKKSTKSKPKTEAKPALSFKTPQIEDNGSAAGVYEQTSGLYIWNKTAFELFYGSDNKAKEYAELINSAKDKLGEGISVYSLLIPNHTEMGLPSRLKGDSGAPTTSQADYIKTSYEAMDDDVTYINAYDNLAEHCNEYIYFSSDHHWTGLGAYYAYRAFASQTNRTPIELSSMQENKIDGFKGSFTELTSATLDTDTVHFWSMPFDVTNSITQANGTVVEAQTMYYWGAGAGSNTYGVFLYGDNPLEVIKSKSETASDEKIAIIHESYGNALVPYFAANFSEIHSIDFRSFKKDLKTYCAENGITHVLFANGVMSSATEDQLQSMRGIIG